MNCKQGDLAIIVSAFNHENIGKIVEVVRPYEGEVLYDIRGVQSMRIRPDLVSSGSLVWVVRSHGSPLLWQQLYTGAGKVLLCWERPILDSCLRPIPRLDEPEETTTDKELTV